MQTNSTSSFSDGAGASSGSSVNAVYKGVDAAGAALHSGIDKVVDPARQAVDSLSNAAHGTVDKLASVATKTADRISDQTRRVTDSPARALDYSKSWVQDKPLEAVGAALVIGFVLGRLTGR